MNGIREFSCMFVLPGLSRNRTGPCRVVVECRPLVHNTMHVLDSTAVEFVLDWYTVQREGIGSCLVQRNLYVQNEYSVYSSRFVLEHYTLQCMCRTGT